MQKYTSTETARNEFAQSDKGYWVSKHAPFAGFSFLIGISKLKHEQWFKAIEFQTFGKSLSPLETHHVQALNDGKVFQSITIDAYTTSKIIDSQHIVLHDAEIRQRCIRWGIV